jgi:hypothetical protein
LFNISLNDSIPHQLTEKTEIREARYSGYHVVATPDAGFMGYNDNIQIKIFATDVEQNAMKDTLTTRFFTQIDRTAPEITVVSPKGEKVDIRPRFNVKFRDVLSGVDTATVVFRWKYIEESMYQIIPKSCYPPDSIEAILDTLNYIFFRAVSFEYDRYIDLSVQAADKEGNPVTHQWQIKTRKYDEEPPWIEYVDPMPKVVLSTERSSFTFHLGDRLSYVVKDNIVVDILAKSLRDTLGLFSRDWHFQYGDSLTDVTEYSNYLVVTLTPPVDDPFQFYYNDKVEMEVRAEDAYANPAKFDTIFSTPQDLAAPYLVSSDPSDESTNNPLNTGIRLELADDLAGILLSTIRVKILDQARSDAEPDALDWENAPLLYPGDMDVTSQTESMPAPVNVTLEMPSGKRLFAVNRTIWLQIYAEDNVARLPNKMTEVISFNTEEKLPDLSILAASYPPGKYVVGDTVKVTAKIANQFAVVPYAFDVTFELEGVEDAQDTVMVPGGFDAPVGKDTTGILPLNSQGKFRIVITVDKQNSVMEQDETNNNYYLNIEVHGGKLVVKSNPFTPNDDGINDDACFYCDQFKLENPCIKIFDLRGRFIKELGGNDFYDKKFRWDGRDTSGNEVMPGVFLYILQDKGQPITNGCVVVAR